MNVFPCNECVLSQNDCQFFEQMGARKDGYLCIEDGRIEGSQPQVVFRPNGSAGADSSTHEACSFVSVPTSERYCNPVSTPQEIGKLSIAA